ncbi:helix-turn-helix domain-containing protein [Actinobacteria bacterium YIM 96077]|uniref:Transcriptional regulator n=1 Tax=Phytoactinopolyspora halophila TaxID=1981511 RepID=A0A329QPD9_9ACTN|nr:helix-turn-helix domain-containing protein [Phytoactinopolyspora halophila]AYY14507.1 helix-turn-helix domain-containing protein [Actinobacteria bacterium YIM 96077]RAW14113.1 transcriptional regulator [Phytoactinopolyspora halophila]
MAKSGVGEFLREQRRAAQLSLRQLADLAGVSNPYLSQIERGVRKPSADVLQQLAKALRMSSEVLYVQAGLLDAPSEDRRVEGAIRADPALTEQQKRALLEVYMSFRAANGGAARDGSQAASGAEGHDETSGAPAPGGVAVGVTDDGGTPDGAANAGARIGARAAGTEGESGSGAGS